MSDWISIEDRLPEKDCLYIVCQTICMWQNVFGACWKGGKWVSVVTSNQLEHITHWMPLPEPPIEKSQKEIEMEKWSLMS